MLRASCEAKNISFDPGSVVNQDLPCEIEHYQVLINFADALIEAQKDKDPIRLNVARQDLQAALGKEGVTRAAAVVANFQMMNRALDTLGAQLGKELTPGILSLANKLNMTVPSHWT